MATLNKKVLISASSAILFFFVNAPEVYKITNNLINQKLINSNNCPTNLGILIHTIIFFVLTYLSMGNSNQSDGTKLKHSIYGTLIFFFVSNPVTYSFIVSLFGKHLGTDLGCPTLTGRIVHSFIYCIALIGVMYLP